MMRMKPAISQAREMSTGRGRKTRVRLCYLKRQNRGQTTVFSRKRRAFERPAQVIHERNAARRLTNLNVAFPPPGKNLNRTPIFHLAARSKRRNKRTETTVRVRIPSEPAIGRSKNAN